MNNEPLYFTVAEDGDRADKFLQESLEGMSRSQAQKWLSKGFVKING